MKKFLKFFLLLLLLAVVYAVYSQYPKLNILAGYSAKSMASSVFVAKRDATFTDETDNNFTPISLADDEVNSQEATTTASVYGLLTRKAMYREGLGCTLLTKGYDINTPYLSPKRTKTDTNLPYPYGNLPQKDTVFSNVNYKELQQAVNNALDSVNKTRAVLVIYKDQIIAEKYADGFDKDSKLLGWSMTKSLTGTMYGILQSQRKLNVNDKAPIDVWKNDERSNITLNNLLQMNSGLAWNEDYDNISDVTKMLFLSEDMGQLQADKKLTGKPNESFCYSSGTTNLLSKILRSYYSNHQAYLDAWYSDFIDKIGAHSMTVEADLSGTYVGSSYAWATARDWAKFGLLYLHKGNWNGAQVFDESWVKYATSPTNSSKGSYGAQIWLNVDGVEYSDGPEDLFSFNGYQGQRVYTIPSKDLVIVRMGLKVIDHNKMLKEILSTIN